MTISHKLFSLGGLLVAPLLLGSGALAGDHTRTPRDDGDVLMYALPLSALGATFLYDDKAGRQDYYKIMLSTALTVEGTKRLVGKLRPDGGSRNSYPSGHTAAAFSGASFLQHRYGAAWGVPAYVLAAYTGYSRVWADAHHVDDVIAGASIAVLNTLFWSEPMDGPLQVQAQAIEEGMAISFNYFGSDHSTVPNPQRYKSSFTFSFGPAHLQHNIVGDSSGSSNFDTEHLRKINDPTTTSLVSWQRRLDKHWELSASAQPFEARDVGTVDQDFSFGSLDFRVGDRVLSRYRKYEVELGASYYLLDTARWALSLGAGAHFQYTSMELVNSAAQSAKKNLHTVTPTVNGILTYRFNPRWSTHLMGHYGELSKINIQTYSVGVNYLIDDRWSTALNYSDLQREIGTASFYDDTRYKIYSISLSYSF